MALSDACPPHRHFHAVKGSKGSNQLGNTPEFGCHPSMLAAFKWLAIKPDCSGAGSLGQDEGGPKALPFSTGSPRQKLKISLLKPLFPALEPDSWRLYRPVSC